MIDCRHSFKEQMAQPATESELCSETHNQAEILNFKVDVACGHVLLDI